MEYYREVFQYSRNLSIQVHFHSLFRYNTLHLSNWSSEVVTIIAEYQTEVIAAAERGFDGKDIPGEKTNIISTFGQPSLSFR